MAPEFSIRPSTLADTQLLPEIERQADKIYQTERFPVPMGVCTFEELEEAVSKNNLFVAECAGSLVGFAYLRPLGSYLHLQQLSVLPGYGQKGIGTSLLDTALAHARKTNSAGVTLTTFNDLRWIARFYQQHGFVDVTDVHDAPEVKNILNKELQLGLENRVAMICME